jgi:hypothetical protein
MLSPLSRFLPETLHTIVGDGSIRAGWIYTPPISVVGKHHSMGESNEPPRRKPFTNPLLMFAYPDVFVLLIFNGTYYAVMYGVTASLSVVFEDVYPYLTEADVGLCFLAIGGGMLIGTWLSGKLTDSYYRKIRDDFTRQVLSNSERAINPNILENDSTFPIEKARLQVLPPLMFVYTACVIGYGWALESRSTIAVPLILQIVCKFNSSSVLHTFGTSPPPCSWRNGYPDYEPYPDSVGRSDAQPRVLNHRMCTSGFANTT